MHRSHTHGHMYTLGHTYTNTQTCIYMQTQLPHTLSLTHTHFVLPQRRLGCDSGTPHSPCRRRPHPRSAHASMPQRRRSVQRPSPSSSTKCSRGVTSARRQGIVPWTSTVSSRTSSPLSVSLCQTGVNMCATTVHPAGWYASCSVVFVLVFSGICARVGVRDVWSARTCLLLLLTCLVRLM